MIDFPKTKAAARRTIYNRWAGNPKGTAFKEGLCAYDVHDSVSGLFYQCSRKAAYGPGNLYCKVHAKRVETRYTKGAKE